MDEVECNISYFSECGSEKARKESGSYYTPSDVAIYFWNEFFSISEIRTPQDATTFLQNHSFIEPSAGAGVFVFSLFQKLAELGVARSVIVSIDITIIDINEHALSFVENQFAWLSEQWGVSFPNVKLVCNDFLQFEFKQYEKPQFYFGNPPFVSNERGASDWKNLFADFVEIALKNIRDVGSLQFILPLSVAFSKDYRKLRDKFREFNRVITLSNFDNIPDTLFKSGKPKHTNSNKANSQRCSILTLRPAKEISIRSSQLLRWSKQARSEFFARSPQFHDVTFYQFDEQIPRPENDTILRYIYKYTKESRLSDLFSANGSYCLYVASVARYYIGIRENTGPYTHKLSFDRKKDFYRALLILSSDLFINYWRTVGDGFHVTKRNIYDFPFDNQLIEYLDKKQTTVRKIWLAREKYKKSKLNSGQHTHSYDFSNRMPSLLELFSGLEK